MFKFEIKDEFYTWYAQTDNKFVNEDHEDGKGLFNETRFEFYYLRNQAGSKPTTLGGFYFSPMPGCCGIVVSHNTFLHIPFRNSNISDKFRQLKTELAKKLGYTIMIATTQMDNLPGVGNMIKSKYKMPVTFINKRTNNLIGLGYKVL